jgi:hypothetical protein
MKRLVMLSAAFITSFTAVAPTNMAMAASIGSRGTFSTVEKATSGKAKIIRKGNVNYLELSADFRTSKDGPDLKVILFDANRIPLNIKGRKYYKLGALRSYSGKQLYRIPGDINLNKIKTVGIYCEKYDATFGYAPLL